MHFDDPAPLPDRLTTALERITLAVRSQSWRRARALQRHVNTTVTARPCAHRLARAQAAAGIEHLATARHSLILLDAFSARLIGYLDGTRDVTQLKTLLTDDILERRLVLPNLKPATAEELQAQVGANVQLVSDAIRTRRDIGVAAV